MTYASPIGIWLPLVTPFRDGAVDHVSVRRLVAHYAASSIDGLILAATTGEGLTLDDDEVAGLVATARAALSGTVASMPVWLGLCGSDTAKLVKQLGRADRLPVDGYLIASPYYTRPSQDGLYQHFSTLAAATDRPIMIYNIPYRTGVNLGNETMLRLAALPNIVGVKDCCANADQSFDLTRDRPAGFSVLTGEDAFFQAALAQGADGGVLASAHAAPRAFASVRALFLAGKHDAALAEWRTLVDIPRLLFTEPSPGPVKHWLWRAGLIDSPEVRLPMTRPSAALMTRIDAVVQQTIG